MEINSAPNSPSNIYVYSTNIQEDNYDIIFNKLDDDIELVLPDDFNEELTEQTFPDNLTSIVFGKYFNSSIKLNCLPSKLKYLVFGECFNKVLSQNVLPTTLISLIFGKYFNQILDIMILPESLLYLKFGEKFNKDLKQNILPNSLITLEFDKYSNFNKKIKKNILPNSIIKMIFGKIYNHELKLGRLPNNLKYLEVGSSNVNLWNLPLSVEIVCFDTLPELLPQNVNKVIIKNLIFNGKVNLIIPSTLNEIQLINYKIIDNTMLPLLPVNCNLINKFGEKINL